MLDRIHWWRVQWSSAYFLSTPCVLEIIDFKSQQTIDNTTTTYDQVWRGGVCQEIGLKSDDFSEKMNQRRGCCDGEERGSLQWEVLGLQGKSEEGYAP